MRHLRALFGCMVVVGCSSAPNPPADRLPKVEATNPKPVAAPSAPPVWFVETGSQWLDTTDAGIRRVLAGSRFETQGRRIVGVTEKPDQLDGARIAPPWLLSGQTPCRYVFWRDRELFGAPNWLGEARLVATLDAPVEQSFDWFDGVGLTTHSNMFVVRAADCSIEKVSVAGAAEAQAMSAKAAVVLTALGHARLTLDGGKSFRDVSADLPGAAGIERADDKLFVTTEGDRVFVLDAQGVITSRKRTEFDHAVDLSDPDDRWPVDQAPTSALQAAVTNGLVLPNDMALVADDGTVARVDLRTGLATQVIRDGDAREDCAPVEVKDRVLILCERARRASVLDAGTGLVERSFDLEEEPAWDRFVAVDGDAIGFVGECAGRSSAPPVDVVSSASPTNTSTQRSPTFCVRTKSGTWVEHRVDVADASDVVAWIPRSDGGAVAVVAVAGSYFYSAPRVEVRGTLRVVRVGRNETPLDISPYAMEPSKLLSRALRVLPDGSIEGWIASGHSASGLMSVFIDSSGKPKQRPFPSRTSSIMTAGRFAIARTEDGLYFQTVDFGRSFQRIDMPPGRHTDALALSAAGVQIGPFIRIGWGESTAAKLEPPPQPDPMAGQARYVPPLVRLGCRSSGPTSSRRSSESYAIGFSTNPTSQMSPGRINLLGAFYVPWRNMQGTTAGDADFVYVPLFDLAVPVKRATVPLSRLDPEQGSFHEIRLGQVLDGSDVWSVAAQTYAGCLAPLVDESGLTVPIGGCVKDPAIGVNIDGRLIFVHQGARYLDHAIGKLDISTATLSSTKSGQTKLHATNLKEVGTIAVPGALARYTVAAGRRGKTPVIVALDKLGNATLAQLDASLTAVGQEEPLAPLSKLQLGTDARCAEAPDDARVLLSFKTEIGLDPVGIPGVHAADLGGLAVLRWSKDRVCLDAIDRSVHDERHESDQSLHSWYGPVRKIVARFDRKNQGKGALVLLTYGTELRQPVTCDRVLP